MFARIGRKKFSVYAIDFETHNDNETKRKGETSIWLGCLLNENSKVEEEKSYFYTVESLLEQLENLTSGKRKHGENRPIKNLVIYDYNLAFEWSFIFPILKKQGFTFKQEINKDDEFVFNSICTKSVSSVWEARIKFGKKNGIVIFRDLAKIYGGGLGKVAKNFGLQTQKGEIDYNKNRLKEGYVPTKEEKEYCFNDTFIIVEILQKIINEDDKDFFQSLSSASYAMRDLLKRSYPKKLKPYKEFRKDYPCLDRKETEFLRHTVSGGLCYANPLFQFKDIKEKVAHIDAHSMHPSSAYLYPYPYGKGVYGIGKPNSYYRVINACHVYISYSGVNLHSVIQLIGNPITYRTELWLWDFEIETMKKAYQDLEIEYVDYYQYQVKMLPFRKFYKHHFDLKEQAGREGNKYEKARHKLFLNSSYGKLLEKPHLIIHENIIDIDGIIDSKCYPKERKEKQGEEEWENSLINAKYTYLPIGSCIPARSRCRLVELALKLGKEYCCYFDTDSIFFIWNETTQKRYNTYVNLKDELGGWGLEEICERAQFTAPKRYKTQNEDNEINIKSGGINFRNYIDNKAKEQGISDPLELEEFRNKYEFDYEEINIISSKWKVQRAFKCRGGTIIDFQEKEMSVQKKYIDIYNNNC